MREILQNIRSQPLEQVLKAYTIAWQQGISTPPICLYLSNGQQLCGELLDVDFSTRCLSLRLKALPEKSLEILFVDFVKIDAFALQALDQNAGFVNILGQ